jgi:hypothetical protein
VKLNDDLMSATRIAVMARRYGKLGEIGRGVRHQHSNYGFAQRSGPVVKNDYLERVFSVNR